MKKFCLVLSLFTSVLQVKAQVAKKSIIEHFTNTKCSICASTNPAFYTTLSNYPNVLHIAFHPSSPYASCVFSQANKSENDARTNYYGLFGSTPKFVLNGVLMNVSNTNNNLTNVGSEMSNFSINSTHEFIGADSAVLSIIIKKVANDTLQNASLFVGVAEDSVFQTTGNGESVHYDVFRKGLTNLIGDVVNLTMNINDSVISIYGFKALSTWDSARLHAISILQNTNTKMLIQSDESIKISTPQPNGIAEYAKVDAKLFPNPSQGMLFLENWQTFSHMLVRNIDGKILLNEPITSSSLNLNTLNNGIYIIELLGKNGKQFKKITIN